VESAVTGINVDILRESLTLQQQQEDSSDMIYHGAPHFVLKYGLTWINVFLVIGLGVGVI
jgi:hypothetical protein